MRSRNSLPLRQAVALGALHGPAELLPISSSGHTALIPWLLSWDYVELDHELRKSFEVALHAGTAAALLITLRGEVGEAVAGLNSRRLALIGLSFAPAALQGLRLRRRGPPPRARLPFAAGAAAAFVSTLGSTWVIHQVERDRSLLPYAIYRIGLAALVLRRLATGKGRSA